MTTSQLDLVLTCLDDLIQEEKESIEHMPNGSEFDRGCIYALNLAVSQVKRIKETLFPNSKVKAKVKTQETENTKDFSQAEEVSASGHAYTLDRAFSEVDDEEGDTTVVAGPYAQLACESCYSLITQRDIKDFGVIFEGNYDGEDRATCPFCYGELVGTFDIVQEEEEEELPYV